MKSKGMMCLSNNCIFFNVSEAYISDRGIDPLVYAKYKLDLIDYETVINSEYSKKMIEM